MEVLSQDLRAVGVRAHSESAGWEERLLHGTVESKGMEWGRGGEGPQA